MLAVIVIGRESGGKQNESQDSNLSFLSAGIHVYLNSFRPSASAARTLSEWTVTKLFTPCRSRRMRSHLRQTRTETSGTSDWFWNSSVW